MLTTVKTKANYKLIIFYGFVQAVTKILPICLGKICEFPLLNNVDQLHIKGYLELLPENLRDSEIVYAFKLKHFQKPQIK